MLYIIIAHCFADAQEPLVELRLQGQFVSFIAFIAFDSLMFEWLQVGAFGVI